LTGKKLLNFQCTSRWNSLWYKKLCYCRGTTWCACQYKSCQLVHKYTEHPIWNGLQSTNNLQVHSSHRNCCD